LAGIGWDRAGRYGGEGKGGDWTGMAMQAWRGKGRRGKERTGNAGKEGTGMDRNGEEWKGKDWIVGEGLVGNSTELTKPNLFFIIPNNNCSGVSQGNYY